MRRWCSPPTGWVGAASPTGAPSPQPKFGIEGLMQTLAEELRDSSPIRVNSLDPGILQTGLRTRLYPGEDPKRWPEADAATPGYLYLLGPDAKGISAQALGPEIRQG